MCRILNPVPSSVVNPQCCRWGLGVLAYVLLTGRQPFSSPKTDDPMVVMRRIVDDNWHIKYPPYLSAAAKVGPMCYPFVAGTADTQKCEAGTIIFTWPNL